MCWIKTHSSVEPKLLTCGYTDAWTGVSVAISPLESATSLAGFWWTYTKYIVSVPSHLIFAVHLGFSILMGTDLDGWFRWKSPMLNDRAGCFFFPVDESCFTSQTWLHMTSHDFTWLHMTPQMDGWFHGTRNGWWAVLPPRRRCRPCKRRPSRCWRWNGSPTQPMGGLRGRSLNLI